MAESHFERVTRRGIETRITDAHNAGDSNLANAQLDIYPTGRPRPELSLEVARHAVDAQSRLTLQPPEGVLGE